MTNRKRTDWLLTLFALAWLLLWSAAAHSAEPFELWFCPQGNLHGEPEREEQWVAKPLMISEQFLVTDGKIDTDKVDSRIRIVNERKFDFVILDIESMGYGDDDRQAIEELTALKKLAERFKSECPDARIAYYGVMPIRDWWAPVNYRLAKWAIENGHSDWASARNLPKYTVAYQAWLHKNNRPRVVRLHEAVDVICPTIYQLYGDKPGERTNARRWEWYAEENIVEARKYGKPVIPVLWPQAKDTDTWVPNFGEQLRFVKSQNVLGLCVWNGPAAKGEPPKWDEKWQWLNEFRAFARKNRR